MLSRALVFATFLVVVLVSVALTVGAEEPLLPLGLTPAPTATEDPPLPTGLAPAPSPFEAPPLPPGLERRGVPCVERTPRTSWTQRDRLPFDLVGFVEVAQGMRTQDDPHEKQQSLGESRLHLEFQGRFSQATFNLTSDFVADWVDTRRAIDLEHGEGWIDLREANVELNPLDFLDMKIGRQILTWGTGDLVFINDLFPKDWQAFFIGRDEAYLKAPSDAVKASLFSRWANLDLVYTPAFDADRYIDGQRLSYWNPLLMRRTGRDAPLDAEQPDGWFRDNEWAVRLYRHLRTYELAWYGYYGFWNSPGGFDQRGRATFPRLAVYGASVRGPIWQGIASAEVGYYDSLKDRDGDDPLVRNSEFCFLAGYEQEIGTDFTAGLQYVLEHMFHHDRFLATQPNTERVADEDRHFLTLRLTKLVLQQNLILSFFIYYSPSDQDAYLRPRVQYKFTDAWLATLGGNIFVGKDAHTFFSQFEKNSNVYVRLRYSF